MLETLLGGCLTVTLVLGIGVPLTIYTGWFGWLWLRARRARARALREACMICDAPVDEALDGTYTCSRCGFDVAWRDDPAKRATFERARELRLALSALETGMAELDRAVVLARANVWGLGRVDLKYRAVEDAEQSFVEGHRLMQDLVRGHPELADFPFPTELISDIAHGDRESGSLLGLLLSIGIRRRVRDRLVEAYEQAGAAIAVLEAVLADIGEDLGARRAG